MVRHPTDRAVPLIVPKAKDAVPALIEALRDKDQGIRRSAAYALALIGSSALNSKAQGAHPPGLSRFHKWCRAGFQTMSFSALSG